MIIDLYVYNNCDIIPSKNMMVDDVDEYLENNVSYFMRANINIPKIEKSMDIKIKREFLDQIHDNFNYAMIVVKNDAGVAQNKYYFFITSSSYHINSMTMSLHLELDSIVTFWDALKNKISPLTSIERQHKDRWQLNGNYIRPIVNDYDEGIHPIQYMSERTKITNSDDSPSRWYFVYTTTASSLESGIPFEVLLAPDRNLYAIGPSQSSLYDADDVINMSDIDFSDSKILKIVQAPYSPTEIHYIAGYGGEEAMVVPNGSPAVWGNYKNKHCLKFPLYDPSKALYYKRKIATKPIFSAFPKLNPINWPFDQLGGILETKLLNSAFSSIKVVYENNSYSIDRERISFSWEDEDAPNSSVNYSIEFSPSREVSGNFMFKVNIENCTGMNRNLNDFEEFVYCETHNEKALFHSDYLNYMRMGYNYDVKQKNRQATISAIGSALSVGGALASFASGPLGVVAGVSLATSAISNAVNLVSSLARSEDQIAQKQNQLRQQAGSVSNNDLLDLKELSTDNRIYEIKYSVTGAMKRALLVLFHLTGYACSECGVPNFSNRYWFNFAKFNPIFKDINSINSVGLTNEFLEDFTSRCQSGVTIYHQHGGIYDFNQIKENGELFLYE